MSGISFEVVKQGSIEDEEAIFVDLNIRNDFMAICNCNLEMIT